MLTSMRIAAAILGARWFIVISFVLSMVLAVPWISRLDERHMERGDQPHTLFTVVWQPGAANEPFGYSKLDDLAQLEARVPMPSFIVTPGAGRLEDTNRSIVSYQVLSGDAAQQFIEVRFANDTYDSWSRYRATRSEVIPAFSKIREPGQMIKAIALALAIALAIFFMGRGLGKLARRR